jgi:hypothetical protein
VINVTRSYSRQFAFMRGYIFLILGTNLAIPIRKCVGLPRCDGRNLYSCIGLVVPPIEWFWSLPRTRGDFPA